MNKQTTASKVAEHKIIKARTSIVQEGRLGMASMIIPLILKEVSEEVCSTMATDGTHIFWCDSFINKSTHEELKFVLMHEAMHCIWAHHLTNQSIPQLKLLKENAVLKWNHKRICIMQEIQCIAHIIL